MKSFIKFTAVLFCLFLPLGAEATPVSDKTLDAFFKASNMDQLVDQSMQATQAQASNGLRLMIEQMDLTQEQKQLLFNDLNALMMPIVKETVDKVSWQDLKPAVIEIYRKSFTEEEVLKITKFYQTPEGKALLEKTPKLMADVTRVTQEYMAPMLYEMNQKLEAAVKARINELSTKNSATS